MTISGSSIGEELELDSRSSGLQSDALGNKEPSPGVELNTEVQKGRCESAGPRKEGTVRGDCTNTRAGVLWASGVPCSGGDLWTRARKAGTLEPGRRGDQRRAQCVLFSGRC